MNIKERFIAESLVEEAATFKRIQDYVIAKRTRPRTGRLGSGRLYTVSSSGAASMLSLQHPVYERFIDMRRLRGVSKGRRKRQIHNKFVWSTYAVIAGRMMHGFTEEAAEEIRREYGDAGK